MLDLSFGLPIVVRDAALKMVAPGPGSNVNREYYAQNHEREIEEGRGPVEEYEKTDEKARELLRRLAQSEPYYKKQRRLAAAGEEEGGDANVNAGEGSSRKAIMPAGESGPGAGPSSSSTTAPAYGPTIPSSGTGPVRTSDFRRGNNFRGRGGGRGRGRGSGRPYASHTSPPTPEDYLPPTDKNITSLFLTGVEDDLPEHHIRSFFAPFGAIRSLVCSHRAHCAFVNYVERASAEKAAAECKGRCVVNGVPLRVQWGKPKPLDDLDREERMANARAARGLVGKRGRGGNVGAGQRKAIEGGDAGGDGEEGGKKEQEIVVAPPPGSGNVNYSSLRGD